MQSEFSCRQQYGQHKINKELDDALASYTYIHTYIHTNLYSAKIVERIVITGQELKQMQEY